MAQGYVFWCSRCKDRHAGDCPTVDASDYVRVGNRNVTIGSRWVVECEYPVGCGQWEQRPDIVFLVLSYDQSKHEFKVAKEKDATLWDLNLDAWLETGQPVRGWGMVRLVPLT